MFSPTPQKSADLIERLKLARYIFNPTHFHCPHPEDESIKIMSEMVIDFLSEDYGLAGTTWPPAFTLEELMTIAPKRIRINETTISKIDIWHEGDNDQRVGLCYGRHKNTSPVFRNENICDVYIDLILWCLDDDRPIKLRKKPDWQK